MHEYLCRPGERLSGRSFADPEKTLRDIVIMEKIIDVLRTILRASAFRNWTENSVLMPQEGNGPHARAHRFIINNPQALHSLTTMTLVGFFGHRHRLDVDSAPLEEADRALLSEFSAHSGMLAYCSYQRSAAQYGNLVLFDTPASQQHWSTSRYHAHIANEISPRYYSYIRLHNGRLVGNLPGETHIFVDSTKYFDYAGAPNPDRPWRGRRNYASPNVQDHAA